MFLPACCRRLVRSRYLFKLRGCTVAVAASWRGVQLQSSLREGLEEAFAAPCTIICEATLEKVFEAGSKYDLTKVHAVLTCIRTPCTLHGQLALSADFLAPPPFGYCLR